MKQIYTQQLEDYESIFVDIKKEMHYSKCQGKWHYSDRGEDHMENWSGPFDSRLDALLDAVEPYLEDSE
jgi:hypothetical protein